MTLKPRPDVMALGLIAGQNARTAPEKSRVSVTYGAYVQARVHGGNDDSRRQNCQAGMLRAAASTQFNMSPGPE